MVQVRTRGMSDSAQACKKLWSTERLLRHTSPRFTARSNKTHTHFLQISNARQKVAKVKHSESSPAHAKKPHTPRRAANVWPRANVGKMSLAFDEFGRPFIIIRVRGRPVAAHPRSARKQRPAAISRVCPPPRDRLRLRVSAHLSDPSLRDDRSKATRAGSAASRRRRRTSRRRNLSRARSAHPSAPRCVEQAIDLATPRGLGRHRNEHRFQTRPAKKKSHAPRASSPRTRRSLDAN